MILMLVLPAAAASVDLKFLTDADRRWLEEHPVITLAVERNYAPFTYLDEYGAPQGLSIDYVRIFERRLGVSFKIVSSDNLSVNLERARLGHVDVLTSLMQTPERAVFLKFTQPYVSLPAVLIVRNSYAGPALLKHMDGRLVAVGKGYAVAGYLKQRYPRLKLVEVSDDVAALKSLAEGRLDAAVVDVASASSIINKYNLPRLRMAGATGFTYDLSFASRADQPQLARILERTLEQISPQDQQRIYRKWIRLDRPHPLWVKLLALSGLVVLAVMLLVLASETRWNQALKRLVAQRTQALESELDDHRTLELELKASELKFRTLAESIREIFWIVKPDWNMFEYVSPAYELIWGRSCESLYRAPRSWIADVLEDDRATLQVEISGRGYQDLRNPDFQEFRIRRADGAIRWIRARVYPIWGDNGQLKRIAGVAEDITERKQSLAEMAVIAEISRLLQRSTPNVYADLAAIIQEKLKFPLVSVELYDAMRQEMLVAGTAGFPARFDNLRIPLHASISSRVIASGQAVCEARQASEVSDQAFKELRALQVEAFLCVPINFDEQIVGTLILADRIWRSDVEAWTPILKAIATFLGHEIRRRQIGDNLQASEKRFRAIADYTYDWESWIDPDGRLIWVSPSVERLTGYTPDECLSMPDYPLPLAHAADRPKLKAIFGLAQKPLSGNNLEFRINRKDGCLIWGAVSWQPICDADGNYLGLRASVRDITKRRLAECIMRIRLDLLQFAATHSLQEIMTETLDSVGSLLDSPLGFYHFLAPDQNTLTLQTWSSATLAGMCKAAGVGSHYSVSEAGIWIDCIRERAPVIHNDYATEPRRRGLPEGHVPVIRELIVPVFRGELIVAVLGIGNKPVEYTADDVEVVSQLANLTWDIVEKKRTEDERANLQTQLMQAQKLESVGRLAGGVAHDFNNMLMVIIGHAEMGLNRLDPGSPLIDELKQILNAAQRSSDLTTQLLAFARQQPVKPRVLDLNLSVGGTFKMLSRLIGEEIDLLWRPGADLWSVEIDPTQVDQILANLAVNARDAIGGIGSVTIETRNVLLDEHYCQQQVGCLAGEYVMLTVSDTGKGMDSEIMQHIFEPFFTTKATGKGTGLGLAMVYGIVHQNNGFINVYSEPGLGATFKVYLPRVQAEVVQEAVVPPPKPVQGTETVLLVEDEAALLDLGKTILEDQGYKVLAAQSPFSALQLAVEHSGPVHLLVTDVVMPEMNGRELNRAIITARPEVKTLFMSGYPAELIAHHGVIDEGVNFLQKPFSANILAQKVREVLDS